MNTFYPPTGTHATEISNESELAVYCKITNFSGFLKADKIILQEQYTVKAKDTTSKKGSVRVRKETVAGEDTYTITTKLDRGENLASNNTEYSRSIDKEFFDAFKEISSSGMLKTRYVFSAKSISLSKGEETKLDHSNTFFEVDVFKDKGGNVSSWCKIDIELDDVLKQAYTTMGSAEKFKLVLGVSKLPFQPVDIFTSKTADATQKQILDHLYKYVFTIQS